MNVTFQNSISLQYVQILTCSWKQRCKERQNYLKGLKRWYLELKATLAPHGAESTLVLVFKHTNWCPHHLHCALACRTATSAFCCCPGNAGWGRDTGAWPAPGSLTPATWAQMRQFVLRSPWGDTRFPAWRLYPRGLPGVGQGGG